MLCADPKLYFDASEEGCVACGSWVPVVGLIVGLLAAVVAACVCGVKPLGRRVVRLVWRLLGYQDARSALPQYRKRLLKAKQDIGVWPRQTTGETAVTTGVSFPATERSLPLPAIHTPRWESQL